MDNFLTPTQLKKLRVVDLKEKLAALGLPLNGLKADLIKRLSDYYASQQKMEVAEPVVAQEPAPPPTIPSMEMIDASNKQTEQDTINTEEIDRAKEGEQNYEAPHDISHQEEEPVPQPAFPSMEMIDVNKQAEQSTLNTEELDRSKESEQTYEAPHEMSHQEEEPVPPPTFSSTEMIDVSKREEQDKLPSSGRAIIFHSDKPISENLRNSVLRDCTKLGLGGYKTSKKSHDWVISRQRYWGTPIPIIDCPSCGPVAVPKADLPVALPNVKDINPLYELEEKDAIKGRLGLVAPKEWLNVNCPKCNRPSVRETDTCDTFFDSSWYYLRYATEPSDSQAFDKETNRKPVHLYVGGAEHSRGHLLYARYIFHFLKSRGFIDSSSNEPFRNLLFLGYVLGRTIKYNDRFITEDEQQKLIDSKKASPDDFVISCEKMSKSKGNGLDPMQLIDRYGIDATRVTLLGFGLPRRAREWQGHKTEYEEIFVILRRLFLTIDQFIFVRELLNETKTAPVVKRFVISREKDQTKIESILTKYDHERKKTIKKVTSIIENEHYPALGVNMLKIFLNLIRKSILNVDVCKKIEFERCLGDIIIMLGPVIPHLAEECWSGFCSAADQKAHKSYYDFQKLVCEQKWPEP